MPSSEFTLLPPAAHFATDQHNTRPLELFPARKRHHTASCPLARPVSQSVNRSINQSVSQSVRFGIRSVPCDVRHHRDLNFTPNYYLVERSYVDNTVHYSILVNSCMYVRRYTYIHIVHTDTRTCSFVITANTNLPRINRHKKNSYSITLPHIKHQRHGRHVCTTVLIQSFNPTLSSPFFPFFFTLLYVLSPLFSYRCCMSSPGLVITRSLLSCFIQQSKL